MTGSEDADGSPSPLGRAVVRYKTWSTLLGCGMAMSATAATLTYCAVVTVRTEPAKILDPSWTDSVAQMIPGCLVVTAFAGGVAQTSLPASLGWTWKLRVEVFVDLAGLLSTRTVFAHVTAVKWHERRSACC